MAGRESAPEVAASDEPVPVGILPRRVLVLCALVLFIDGYDTQAIGYVAPALTRTLGIGRAALAPALSAALAGLMAGALVLGPLADRVGRRRVIIASTVVFGGFALLTALAGDLRTLIVLRFLTGLGLGGAMPNAIALTAEHSPERRRATMVMIMFCGFSLGAAVGGLIAGSVIPRYGWRAVFVVGGVAPLLLAPLLAAWLPESSGFPGAGERNREAAPSSAGVSALFAQGRGAATLLFWVVFFMSLLDLYLLSNWLPTVLVDAGATLPDAARLASLLQIGGIAGAVTLSAVIDRFRFKALALTYLGAAVAIGATGLAIHLRALEGMAILAAGFGIVGGQIAANALAAIHYPRTVRSTGVGWALGMGRAGSIVGPLLGGIVLERASSPVELFLIAAVPAVCAALAAVGLIAYTAQRRTS